MRRFLKWPGMVSIQVKLGMVGVCGSHATVPGPRGGEMGIPTCRAGVTLGRAGDHSVVVRGVRT